jgi:anti-sigma B factor antagonist
MSDPTEDRPSPVAVVGEEAVVRLSGRFRSLSAANALALEELLAPLVGAPGARRLTLDCGDVEFLGAAALGTFVRLQRQARARGGRLRLWNVHDPLYEVFEVTHLVGLLNVRRATGDECLQPDDGEWVAEGSLHW